MKYPPFSPISTEGSQPGRLDDDLDSTEDTPIYISFSIETNLSDIGNSADSTSSIEEDGSDDSCKKNSSFRSGHRSNCDRQTPRSSPSNDCSSEESNKMDADSYRGVCNDFNHSFNPGTNCMPCSPDNTIVAKNTRRSKENDTPYCNLSEDSDSNDDMKKTNNKNATFQSNLMTKNESTKFVNQWGKVVSDDTMKHLHQFGSFLWPKARSSNKQDAQLQIQTNVPNRLNEERNITSPTAESRRDLLVMPGCIFESYSCAIDSSEQKSTKCDDTHREDRKTLRLQMVPGNNTQEDENETEQGIEICVSDLESSQQKQTDVQNDLILFLQTMAESSGLHSSFSSIDCCKSAASSSLKYCDVMLSPSSCNKGKYSITILPKKDESVTSISAPPSTIMQKYVISSVVVKSPPKVKDHSQPPSLSSTSSPASLKSRQSLTTYFDCDSTLSAGTLSQQQQQQQQHRHNSQQQFEKGNQPVSSSSSSTEDDRRTTTTGGGTNHNGFKLRQGITPLGKTSILHFMKKKKRQLKNKPRFAMVSLSSRDSNLHYSSSSTTYFSKYNNGSVQGSSSNTTQVRNV